MCLTSLSSWHPTVLLVAMYAVVIVVGTEIMQWWCFCFSCYIKRLFCGLQAGIMVSFYLLQFWLIIVFVLLITICYALYSITSLSSIDSMSIFYVALRQCWDCFETVNRYSSISVEFAFGLALASDLASPSLTRESRGNAGLPEFLQLMLTDEGHICHGHSCVSRAGYRLNYACRIVSPFCTQKLPDKSKVFSMTFEIIRSARVLLRLKKGISYIPYKIWVLWIKSQVPIPNTCFCPINVSFTVCVLWNRL